jgi:hypothetical protein
LLGRYTKAILQATASCGYSATVFPSLTNEQSRPMSKVIKCGSTKKSICREIWVLRLGKKSKIYLELFLKRSIPRSHLTSRCRCQMASIILLHMQLHIVWQLCKLSRQTSISFRALKIIPVTLFFVTHTSVSRMAMCGWLFLQSLH